MIKAELINSMGSDLTVVNAARVSMNKEHTEFQIDTEKEDDYRLIRYLANYNHFTPFTHCMVTMRETVPIIVARQRFKHTVGFSYNEVSRRYVDDTPEFFYPDIWRKRADNVKQGSSNTETVETLIYDEVYVSAGLTKTIEKSGSIHSMYVDHIDNSISLYEIMIENDVAPEQARMVLPQSMLTTYYVTGSLAAWARAYKLRIDPHAQKEITDLAIQWDSIIEPLFPYSWKELTK